MCQNKFHSACVSLRDEICKIVPKVANIYWFCDNCETIVNKNLPKLNAVPDSTHVDIRLCEKEIECLKREKILTDRLLQEMEQSNDLLKSKMNHILKNGMQDKKNSEAGQVFLPTIKPSSSYSAAAKKNLNTDSSVLLIENRDGNSDNILETIVNTINPASLNVCINGTKRTKNGAAIFCNKQSDLEILKDALNSKLGKKVNVNESKKLNPRILIRNVKLTTDLASDNSILDNIFLLNDFQNFSVSDFKIVTKLKTINNLCNIVLEVPSFIYNNLIQRSYIYIGWQRCFLTEHLNITRCYNCCVIGHLKKTAEVKLPVVGVVANIPLKTVSLPKIYV